MKKCVLSYGDKSIFPCKMVERPTLMPAKISYQLKRGSVCDVKWSPLKITLIEGGKEEFLKEKPIKFKLENIDPTGILLETYEISEVESIVEKEDHIQIKFGYAIFNY
jgi:hypothetical protein